MQNNAGFTLVESIVAMTIICSLVLIIVPIHSTLQVEKVVNKQKRDISYRLHDELLSVLHSTNVPNFIYDIEIGHTNIQIEFAHTNELIHACARWQDVKERQQKVCLYGFAYE